MREQWVDAMRNAIDEALSNREVAERIWAEPSNSLCADCGAPKPEWAAINLCVVFCKQCAGLCGAYLLYPFTSVNVNILCFKAFLKVFFYCFSVHPCIFLSLYNSGSGSWGGLEAIPAAIG